MAFDGAPEGRRDGRPSTKIIKFCFDLEAIEWDKVISACFVSEHGDVEHFEGAHSIDDAAAFIDKVGGTHFAHAGGIYDTLLVSQAMDDPWDEVIMSGSAVLTAKRARRRTAVRDTFRAWLSGLKKVGEYLQKRDDARRAKWEAWKARRGIAIGEKVPEEPHAPPGFWLKKDVDRSRIRELSARERREYVESDTQILMGGVKAHEAYLASRKARVSWTAGSAALKLLAALEPQSVSILHAHRLELETAVAACQCVRGARVETFALGRVDNVYTYDRKSAYPASYFDRAIGVGAVHLGRHDKTRPGAVWRVRWFWPWRGGESTITDDRVRIPPVLDQTTGAGCGWCEAWCIDEEITELENFVGVERIEGWAPAMMAPIGQLFVRDLFAEKEAGSFFAKVFLNSLHGKMSETPIKESWRGCHMGEPTDYYGKKPIVIGDYYNFLSVALDKDGLCAGNVQPLGAAHILGRARIALWRIFAKILGAGYAVYYCDTDCVHTNAPPDVMARLFGREYGVGLGQLAPEGGPYTCLYVGPKSYCAIHTEASAAAHNIENPKKPVRSGDVCKGACKGLPWNSLKDGVMTGTSMFGNTYRQARDDQKGQDLRLAVFEEALREHEGAKVVKEGIATWKQGLRMNRGWARFETTRTLAPHERGKLFDRRSGPTAYAYQSPAELLIGRGVDLSHDPWRTLTENPADPDGAEGAELGLVDEIWGEA